MNRILLLCCCLLLTSFAYTQTVTVSLKAISQKGEPVSSATVTVIPLADTTARQNGLTDSLGEARFQLSENALYRIRISSVEYTPLEKSISIKPDATQFRFVLQPASKAMSGIVVTAKKPLLRQEDDKTIVDPEPLANASTNAYEIMEKIPGLFVDQDGNIYISSTTPAKVYINGREQRMSAADMATILKTLPPNAISSIEILRMPSAKYDASGSGGIVNVVLRKGIRIGLTGSVNAGFNQGHFGNQFAGFSLNNNDGKRTYYINFNYNHRNSFERIQTNRYFSKDTVLQQRAYTTYPAATYFVGYGFTDSLGKKWFLDFAGSTIYQTNNSEATNTNTIVSLLTNQPISNSLNQAETKNNYLRFNNGITFTRKMGESAEWSNDFYLSFDRNRTKQQYNTAFSLPVNRFIAGYGSPDNDRNNFVFTSDFKKKLAQKLTLEAGGKASFLHYNSNALYFANEGTGAVKDENRTNTFRYNENINSVYVQLAKTFGKGIILKAGGRVENTNMVGRQLIPADTSFSIHRTDFFPYAYLSKKLMSIAGYDLTAFLVYRRTITRPVYEQLNPFPKYVDQYLSESGNPSLRPQFTQTYEANVSVNDRPIIAFGVNETNDIFNQVVYQADSNRSQAFRTYDNLGKNKETYIRALGALPPGGKYFFVLGAQYNYNFYQGAYENKPLSFKRGSWRLFTYHNLKLSPTTNIYLNGFLMIDGQLQFYELSNFGQANIGLSQQLLNRKLTVSLSGQDIFYTNQNNFVLTQGSVHASGNRRSDTRRFGLNLRYNFGLRKKEEQKLPDIDAASQRP